MIGWLGAAYPWVKAAHLIFVIFWLAGLFMVPRHYIYHSAVPPGSPEDRLWIQREATLARVILNRLYFDMPLQIDSTLFYNQPADTPFATLQATDTPYNTYLHKGLPPTPIANPGLASIRAAAHPARVNYLFFVRKPDKVHHFFTASDSAFAQYECAHGYGC